MRCRFYWGSHGCDLEAGHDQPHVCRACSQFTENEPMASRHAARVDGRVRYCRSDNEQGESTFDRDYQPPSECFEWSPITYPSTGFWA